MVKKIFLSVIVIGAFIAYAIYLKLTPKTALSLNQSSGNEALNPDSNSAANTSQASVNFKDGTYSGSVEDVFYGSYQVKAVVSGGKLTDVTFPIFPDDVPNSQEINTQANPVLKQEAIQSQSANVQIVSGATQSSEGFIKSLQNALSQAKS